MSYVADLIAQLKLDISDYEASIADVKGVTNEYKKDTQTVTQQAKMCWTEVNSAIQVGKQVIGEVNQMIEQTIGVYVQRADAVREQMRLTGDDAETTSRLIEASDDLFLSQQTLTSGMEFAIRQGYKPSVEWLKQMADKIMAIPDPADRAKAAIGIFGKAAGPEMLKLLEQGSAGIDKYMAAIEDGLVVTDEGIAKAQEYKVAMDAWNDTFTAFKMAFADSVIEPFTEAIHIFAILKQAQNEDKQGWQNLIPVYGPIREAVLGISAVIKGLKQDKIDANAVPIDSTDMDDAAKAAADLTQRDQELAKAAQELSAQYTSLLGLTMSLTDESRNFRDKMQELQDQATGLRGKIEDLEVKQYLTEAQKTELAGLKGKLDDVTGAIQATATAHEDACNRIVFALLQAKLSADGLTTAEFDMLTKTGEAMGIIDSQSANTAIAINGLTDDFNAGKLTVDAYYASVQALLNLPDKTLTYTIVYNQVGGTMIPVPTPGYEPVSTPSIPTGPITGYDPTTREPIYGQAEGGDWLVHEPTLFLAGEAGPEEATFTPLDKVGDKASGGNTYNYNISNAGIDAAELKRIQHREELLYGR